MLSTGNDVFLQLPAETQKRLLHPGIILGLIEQGYEARFAEADLPVQAGQDVLVYYTERQEFMKQSAQIESIESWGNENESSDEHRDVVDVHSGVIDGPRLILSVNGDPVSAESRQCFRVSTVIGNHVIQLDDESCNLLDVSFTGFAVQTTRVYEIGRVLETSVLVNGERYVGAVCVQSITELPTGLIRYGLYCTDERSLVSNLKDGLQKLSMTIQREQLNRLAGV